MKDITLMSSSEIESFAQELSFTMSSGNGKTIAELAQVDNHFLERLYSVAYTLYHKEQYTSALNIFDFLTQIDPKSYRFVLGIAATLYQMKKYRLATLSFFCAHGLEPSNPYPLFYLSESLIKEGHLAAAEEALEQTILLAARKPEYKYLKERSIIIKNNLKLNK